MRAWLLHRQIGLEGMSLGELPDPTPGEGEVLLGVRLAALNPADRYLAEGQYPGKPPLPHVLGRDGIGTVLATGPGVSGVSAGDRRIILRGETGVTRPGTLAEKVVVPAASLVASPEGWTDEQAAGATLVYLTAWQAITQWPELPTTATVLVSGASGGVGVAAVQLAHAMGHRVIALSRSEQKSRVLREQGADFTVDPSGAGWAESVRSFLGRDRVDLFIDNIGGRAFNDGLGLLGMNGRVSCVGRLAGPVPDFNTASLFFRRLRIGGVAVGTYSNAEARDAWSALLAAMAKTGARPLVDSVWPFERLMDAFGRLASGPLGKVLVRVGG